MQRPTFPTFDRLLTTFELSRPWKWAIAPRWKLDTWAAQQRTLLRVLAIAAAERIPYGPLVARLAEDHRGFYRWRLAKLAQRLAADPVGGGLTLPDAIEQTPGVLSPEQTLAVRFGAESGTLPALLERLVAEGGNESQAYENGRLHQLGCYLAGIIVLGALILGFIFHLIFPSFRQIMEDFSMDYPPAFEWLVGLGNFFMQFGVLIGLAIAVLLWLFYSQRGWRYFHRVWLPRLSRSATRLRGAEVLGLLAIADEAGRPLAGAISTLARYFYDRRIRGQLLFLRNEMEQGADVWPAMRDAGLVTPAEAAALAAAMDQPARTWTLRKLAELRRTKIANRLHLIGELLHPLAILLLAAAVLLVAIGALSPLLQLITSLAPA